MCLQAILIFYSPQSAEEAFWSQMLSIYSLLFTVEFSILRSSLTQFHAALATVITGSPLTIYLVLYAIVSFKRKSHRLGAILGKGQWFTRLVVIVGGICWVALLFRILTSKHLVHFSQRSCELDSDEPRLANYLYVFPFLILTLAYKEDVHWLIWTVIGIVSLTALSWFVAIALQWRTIWPKEERWSPRIRRVW